VPGGEITPAVTEQAIGMHPEKPDTSKDGVWLLCAIGGGQVGWAWMEAPPPPPAPDQGLPTPPAATSKKA
jgi:hypothetical protein